MPIEATTPAQRSFTQIYFRADRGPDAERDATRVLASLDGVSRAPERGDPFVLRYDYADVTERDVATLFGAAFAARVFALPAGTWQGPVQSSYGYHLVRITSAQDEQPGDYALLHERIRAAWLDDARKQANARVFAEVKSRYRITIADVGAGAPPAARP
jgi:peptidyl-prolyl cis-trans isomerase C